MKTRILLLSLSLFLCALASAKENSNENSQPVITSQVNIVSTSELQGLAKEWSREYQDQHPGEIVMVDVAAARQIEPVNGMLALVNGNEMAKEYEWKMVVGRQVIVPVINSSNPYTKLLYENGVSQERLNSIFTQQEPADWAKLVENGGSNKVNFVMVNDPAVLTAVKKFLRVEAIPIFVKVVENNADLIACLQNDSYAIGFCNLTGIMVPAVNHFADKINILPIDKNNNGTLDPMENLYSDPETFSRGVWIGKYPKSLINEIYAVSSTQPDGTAQIAFLSWILTEGQEALSSYGFNDLVYSEVQSKLDKIEIARTEVTTADTAVSFPKMALFIIAAVLFIGIIVSAIVGFRREEIRDDLPEVTVPGSSFSAKSITAPGGLLYDKSHTWAFMEKDGTVKVGIDDFIQHVAGRITRVEMKKPGEKIKKGDAFLTLIQKGKQLKLYAPVSGTIVENNRALEHSPYNLNASPYADGWIYRMEPVSWLQEIPLLSMAGKYTKWLSEEFTRLKDFLASSMQSHKLEYAHVVMQDGGEMKDNLLEDFGPEVWEDFQRKFIDNL